MSMMYRTTDPVPAPLALIQAALASDDAERVERAYYFAAAAHDGQTRDEGTPYIEHPVRVALILWQELGVRDVDLMIAALNHDVIEDSEDVDDALVRSAFGDRAANLVLDVTKPAAPPDGKGARDRAYLDSLPGLDLDSRLLKLADRIDNLRSVIDGGDRAKARRYLIVSRAEFLPLAAMTDPVAHQLIGEACDAIEALLEGGVP